MFRWLRLARLVLVAGVALGVHGSIAFAAGDERQPNPEAPSLWRAFPLNPTGEQVDAMPASGGHGRSEALRALAETPEPSWERAETALALFAGGAALVLILAAGRVVVQKRDAAFRRRRSAKQLILDYWEPVREISSSTAPVAIAGARRHPDILGRARVRTHDQPAGRARSSRRPPPGGWGAVDGRDD